MNDHILYLESDPQQPQYDTFLLIELALLACLVLWLINRICKHGR